jgi:hypothetical protein
MAMAPLIALLCLGSGQAGSDEETGGEIIAEIGEEVEYAEEQEPAGDEEEAEVKEEEQTSFTPAPWPSPLGHAGLVRAMSAASGGPMSWSVGFTSAFFVKKGFLYTDEVKDAHRRFSGNLHASFTPVRFLELFLRVEFRVDATDLSIQDPQTYRRLGNSLLGLRGVLPLSDVYTISLSVAPRFYVEVDDLPFQWNATSVTLMTAQTLDFVSRIRVPLRIHLNLGWDFDNTARLVEKREAELSEEAGYSVNIMRFERFVLDVGRTDHLLLAVGVEIATPWAAPFIEWAWDVPMARRGFECIQRGPVAFPDDDSCLGREGYKAFHMNLVLGLRLAPVPVPGLGFIAAVDLGLTGVDAHVRELPANPPYVIYLGLSYSGGASEG